MRDSTSDFNYYCNPRRLCQIGNKSAYNVIIYHNLVKLEKKMATGVRKYMEHVGSEMSNYKW